MQHKRSFKKTCLNCTTNGCCQTTVLHRYNINGAHKTAQIEQISGCRVVYQHQHIQPGLCAVHDDELVYGRQVHCAGGVCSWVHPAPTLPCTHVHRTCACDLSFSSDTAIWVKNPCDTTYWYVTSNVVGQAG